MKGQVLRKKHGAAPPKGIPKSEDATTVQERVLPMGARTRAGVVRRAKEDHSQLVHPVSPTPDLSCQRGRPMNLLVA
jgi:hypothetical protein